VFKKDILAWRQAFDVLICGESKKWWTSVLMLGWSRHMAMLIDISSNVKMSSGI
jgi:hypothetical protein